MRFKRDVILVVIILVARVCCNKPCRTNRCKKEAQYLRSSLKLSDDPCQDFYAFACGNFKNYNLMVNGSKSWGPFEIADNAITHAIKAILSSPKQPTDPGALRKAKIMYTSCVDNETREQHGLKPLLRMMKDLGGWPLISDEWNGSVTWGQVARVTAQYGIPLFFDVSVKPHPSNISFNVIHLSAPSLPLPVPFHMSPMQPEIDILVYRSKSDNILRYLVDVTMELRKHVGATHAHKSRIKRELLEMLKLAQKLQIKSSILIFMDPSDKETVPISSLDNGDGQIDWLDFLQTVFRDSGVNVTSEHHVYTGGNSYIKFILQLFKESESRLLANYIIGRLVMHLAPETTERMYGFLMRLYRKLHIIPENYPGWQYCINKVRGYPDMGLGGAIAHDYLKHNFHHENMNRVMQLVEDLRVATQELLDENDWIDEETKRLVMEKTDAMVVLAGFPEWNSNVSALDQYYDKLIIHQDDHFGNVARLRSFMQASNLATLDNKDNPKLKWNSSPFIVNAFYDLRRNSVTLPAGLMQHPFYTGQDNRPRRSNRKKVGKTGFRRKSRGNKKLSPHARKRRLVNESILLALDYARFGSVVGHEITHGFDGDGHLYDGNGEISNIWSMRMELLFAKRTQCFRRQYGRQDLKWTGQDTVEEDVADNGGLRKAYRAFKRASSRVGGLNATLPDLTSFTPEQLFFLGYATLWCHSGEEFPSEYHSSQRDRVIKPLSNMKEFSEAWNCTIDSPMNPRSKCMLW